jgi:hypothetical protein
LKKKRERRRVALVGLRGGVVQSPHGRKKKEKQKERVFALGGGSPPWANPQILFEGFGHWGWFANSF